VFYNPLLDKLLRYLRLLDIDCPVERHELRDEEWLMLRDLKMERDKIHAEEQVARDNEEKDGEHK
jgi:hypothetical protein